MALQQEYLEARVMTASPVQLHLMVVDGALQFARLAEQAMAEQDFEGSHQALNSARQCVCELISGLQADQSPELVERLKSLFAFAYRNLAEADLRHDPQLVRDAANVLAMHRKTWLELIDRLASDSAANVPAPHVSLENRPSDEVGPAGGYSWTT